MLRYVPVLLEIALTVYCLIDAIQTDEVVIRNLPKMAWIFLSCCSRSSGRWPGWSPAGRPATRTGRRRQQQRWEDHRREQERRRPRGPDDDPDFLKDI